MLLTLLLFSITVLSVIPAIGSEEGNSLLANALKDNNIKKVQKALEFPCNINGRCVDLPNSPLVYAAGNNTIEIVELLLEKKADPNGASWYDGSLPLGEVYFRVGQEDIVNLLIKYGADPEKKDVYGKKQTDYAEMGKSLKQQGFSVGTAINRSKWGDPLKQMVQKNLGTLTLMTGVFFVSLLCYLFAVSCSTV